MIRLTGFIVFVVTLLSAAGVTAQREVVDKIVAVVGDEVILASELANQMRFNVLQTGREPKTQYELEKVKSETLDQMVSDQLFLVAARKDTTISLRPEEIEDALDERITGISEGFGSHEAFLAALADEGLTLRDLRKRFEKEIENQMLKQRFIQKKLYSVNVSRHEVEEFYNNFRDSIPNQPEALKLAHILIQVEPAAAVEDSVRELATELRRRILDGADFAGVSTEYSSLGAGANGGDLGYISREDVVEEFARAAFNLSVGDISGVVRTQFGYHIIRCEGKRDDQAHLRHVLLAVQPEAADTSRTLAFVDSLMQEISGGTSFEEIAKAYSTDNDTRAQGGELGWFAVQNMPPEFAPALRELKTPGELRGPVVSQFGIHILKLLEYQPEKQFTLEDDFDQIKELARQDKTGRMVDEWIEDLKTTTLIEVMEDS